MAFVISLLAKNADLTVAIASALLDFLVLLVISPFQETAQLEARNVLVMARVTTTESTTTTLRNACSMVEIAALLIFLVLLAISPIQIALLDRERNSLVMTFVKALTLAVSITTPDVDMTAGIASSKGIDCDAPKRGQS
jgi:hypothetical protein